MFTYTWLPDTLSAMLGNVIGEGQTLDPAGLYVGLFTALGDPMPPYTDAAFVFPAVANFPRKNVLTWTEIDDQPDGSFQVTSPVLDFSFVTFTDPTNFAGAYIALNATAGTTVIAWQSFDDFIQFLVDNAHAKFVARVTIKTDGSLVLDMVRVDV